VERIATKLGEKDVFLDKWVLDAGDILPSELARGIKDSNYFIIIASKQAMKSRWIKYEINLAIVQWIRNQNFKIIVVKIEDCEVPLELKPFIYIDVNIPPDIAIDKIVKIVLNQEKDIIPREDWNISIIDRYDEIGAIERASISGIKFIFLWGIYGIGKSTVALHACDRVFRKPIAHIYLTRGYDELRLAVEMAALSKTDLPKKDTSHRDLLKIIINSIKELHNQGKVIFFDDFDTLIDDELNIKLFFYEILNELNKSGVNIPILFATSRFPRNISQEIEKVALTIKVRQMDDIYIQAILNKWVRLSDPTKKINSGSIEIASKELHGYPLAAKLAANIITKYSIESVIQDLSHFKEIRIDAAKQLIGRSKEFLNEDKISILKILTVAETGLTQYDLSKLLHKDIEFIRRNIDELSSYQFVFFERNWLQILPLMRDYLWRSLFSDKKFKKVCEKIAYHTHNQLSRFSPNSEEFIHYCAITYKLYLLSDKYKEANELSFYFRGEIKEAAWKLYFAKDYKLSLNYVNLILEANPHDNGIRFLKTRCLTRLELYKEALEEIDLLEHENYALYKLYHAKGMIYKLRNKNSEALREFKKGLEIRRDYLPLLRDYGDLLDRIGDTMRAYEIMSVAYSIQPRDKYIAPKYVDILEKLGKIDEALPILKDLVITFPEEASFRHKLSILYSHMDRGDEAHREASTAVALDSNLYEAVMHLAALEIKRENYERAKELLKQLPETLPKRHRMIRDTIMAELCIKNGKLETAKRLITQYNFYEDPYCLNVLAKIELITAKQYASINKIDLAEECIQEGLKYTKIGLKSFPNDKSIHFIYEQLNSLLK
jgi:tetratricopeptide (TPR) repeat protein